MRKVLALVVVLTIALLVVLFTVVTLRNYRLSRCPVGRGKAYLRKILFKYGALPEKWDSTNGSHPHVNSSIFSIVYLVSALDDMEPKEKLLIRGLLNKARSGLAYSYATGSTASTVSTPYPCENDPPCIDSDDTAFAYRALLKIHPEMIDERSILQALKPFRYNNSWVTFLNSNRKRVSAPKYSMYGPHPEVHLNISLLLHKIGIYTPALTDLKLDKYGLPLSYHYPSRFYMTYLIKNLRSEDIRNESFYENYDHIIYTLQRSDGGWSSHPNGGCRVIETCFAILSLNSMKKKEIKQAFSFLCSQQHNSGKWGGGNGVMWQYFFNNVDGITLEQANFDKLVKWVALDSHSMFTTSLAIMALQTIMPHMRGN